MNIWGAFIHGSFWRTRLIASPISEGPLHVEADTCISVALNIYVFNHSLQNYKMFCSLSSCMQSRKLAALVAILVSCAHDPEGVSAKDAQPLFTEFIHAVQTLWKIHKELGCTVPKMEIWHWLAVQCLATFTACFTFLCSESGVRHFEIKWSSELDAQHVFLPIPGQNWLDNAWTVRVKDICTKVYLIVKKVYIQHSSWCFRD